MHPPDAEPGGRGQLPRAGFIRGEVEATRGQRLPRAREILECDRGGELLTAAGVVAEFQSEPLLVAGFQNVDRIARFNPHVGNRGRGAQRERRDERTDETREPVLHQNENEFVRMKERGCCAV